MHCAGSHKIEVLQTPKLCIKNVCRCRSVWALWNCTVGALVCTRRVDRVLAHKSGAAPIAFVGSSTWFKVRQRPVFWPSGSVPGTLRARQCSPTTAPSGAGSGVPFFPGASGVSCCCTPKGPPARREVFRRATASCGTPSFSRTRPPKGDLCGTWSVHA